MDDYEKERMEELNTMLAEHKVILPDGIQKTCLSGVRRPLVLHRGKPITKEQAIQLIVGEEPLFRRGNDERDCMFDPRGNRGVLKNIFYRRGYDWLSTWVHSDGTIGGNLIYLGKYPEIYDILPDYIHLAGKYPFLDMVVSYTSYNECCCYFCDGDRSGGCRDCGPYLGKIRRYKDADWNPDPDFEELYFRSWDTGHVRSDIGKDVELTIWIHEGKTEVLFGDKAKAKFVEYNKQYCSPEYDFMFSADLYSYKSNCICSKEFVEECFEYAGMPRSLCDKYVERDFISPFNTSAQVVTKDWIIEQYRTFISRG